LEKLLKLVEALLAKSWSGSGWNTASTVQWKIFKKLILKFCLCLKTVFMKLTQFEEGVKNDNKNK